MLLLASDFRTEPNWAQTVTPESSPVLKAGHLMYLHGRGTKNFREFADKVFPVHPAPLFTMSFACSSCNVVSLTPRLSVLVSALIRNLSFANSNRCRGAEGRDVFLSFDDLGPLFIHPNSNHLRPKLDVAVAWEEGRWN